MIYFTSTLDATILPGSADTRVSLAETFQQLLLVKVPEQGRKAPLARLGPTAAGVREQHPPRPSQALTDVIQGPRLPIFTVCPFGETHGWGALLKLSSQPQRRLTVQS